MSILNFRTRLLLLQFSTVILMALLLGGGSHFLLVTSLEKQQERLLSHLVSEGAKDIAAMLRERALQMEGLDMESFRHRYGDLPLEKHFLEYFKGFSAQFPVVSLLDQKGDETVKLVNGRLTESYINYQYDPAVQKARRFPNKMHVGLSRHDPQNSQATMHLAYSYVSYFGDEFLGTLLLTLPLEEIDQRLISIARNDDASLALFSGNGDLWTYPRPEFVFEKLPLIPALKPSRYQLFGEDLVVNSEIIANTDLHVLATVPWAVYRAEVNRMRVITLIVCLIGTLLGIFVSWKLSGLLMRNIHQLVDFAERIGQEDYRHQLPLNSDEEFNQLNHAFNKMVAELDSHRRSRDSLQKIIEAIIDPLIVTDRQGMIVQLNQAALDLLSCESAQIINRPLSDLFPTSPLVLRRAEYSSGLLKERVTNLETVIHNHQDLEVPVLFSSAPCERETDEFGVVCILKDITELMAARNSREKALISAEDARRRIDVLLRSVPDGLVVTDAQGRLQLMNDPAEKLLGDQAEQIVRDIVKQLLEESAGVVRTLDIPLTTSKSGVLKIMQAHASEVYDREGGVSGLVMLLRDVSRERSMDQMKNEFISTAAHELRTPLTSILGYSELMLEPSNKERFSWDERQEFLHEILGRAETLARIIDDLLSISRIESGQPLTLEFSSVGISAVLERVVQQFKLTCKGHDFELSLPPQETFLLVDTGRIQQVLENLLSNAVKYSPENRGIHIVAEQQDESYRISIADQGIGMLPEQVGRIFEKFYRVDYGDTKTSGLGIGMSIVKQIIDGHEGLIKISSTLGEGTCIEIHLPLPG